MRICDDLRQAVLQAAIQGKLTKQLPEDGNAADLLKQIAAEKAELIWEGKIKKEKPLPEITPEEVPFDIPENWKWVRWGNLAKSIQYGYNASGLQSGRIKMLRISDISANNTVNWNTVPFCNITETDIDSYLLHPNDILFARTGGTVGKSFLIKELPIPSVFAGYLIRTNYNATLLSPQYLKYFMESFLYWKQLRVGTTKTAQPNCNGQTLSKMLIPLPPLAEQQRIVDRVDELMARIDDLEKTETELEKLKAAFPGDMKAALLQAAMQGKLTEQLPEDDNAADLLEQIVKEKSQLIKEGKIKKEKPLPEITTDEVPFDIPESWKWTYCQKLFFAHSAMRIHQSDWQKSGIPFFRGRELVKLSKTGNPEAEVFITEDFYNKLKEKGGVPKKNDILISAVGTLGRVYVVKGTKPFYYKDAYVLCLDNYGINPQFIKYYLESPISQNYIYSGDAYGTTVAQLTLEKLKRMMIPIPPLAEQKRIVEKLDKLLPLCDGLIEK